MDSKRIVNEILDENKGIVKFSDLKKGGISAYTVSKLCNEGYLEKVKYGYYQLANDINISEEYILAELLPEGIVCLESALFHYGYSDFTPRIWTIAVPRGISRKKTDIFSVPMQVYYVKEDIFELGKSKSNFNGVELLVYDRERTICDCFKYRNRLDNEIFNKAIKAYVLDEHKDLSKLSEYARKLRVYKKVFDLMEVLLDD